MHKLKFLSVVLCCLFGLVLTAQEKPDYSWFNDDFAATNYYGVSTNKAYKMLKGKNPNTVIVAVIDGGVDPMHEDLKRVMWVNRDEIAGNKKDDDNNGYVDDMHGWNFAGGADGKSVNHDTYELTRLYAKYRDMYEGKDRDKLSGKDKKGYDTYLVYKKELEEERAGLEAQSKQVYVLDAAIKAVRAKFPGDEKITVEKLGEVEVTDPNATMGLNMLKGALGSGQIVFEDLEGQVAGGVKYFDNALNYSYNPDFKPRARIVGDNYNDVDDRNYGNNDIKGPDAFHGTHVAGIIAAERDNEVGIDGVANSVKIMGVRAVPNGDERDKDIANAIRYAVDNGASVINMSFGKGYSWDKDIVDEAVKYAYKHDVLLVHAAGNSAQDNDQTDNFPNDGYDKRGFLGLGSKKAKNWLEVGAASWQTGADFTATFSNYGKENVDVFAPGVDIYSTAPDGEYEYASGTSMAAPVTAGVAAMLRSYFPKLTAEQTKQVIMDSVEPITFKVNKPGGAGTTVSMSEISVSGGTINAARAVELAMKTKGKKKIKKEKDSRA